MIDICDFAVGLSRQLYGLAIASERPGHRMTETWHPLGPCAIISAFNFPVAVWSWNAALALVCGDPGDLEAVGEDAALGAGDDEDPRTRPQALRPRRAGRPGSARHRRPGDRRGAGRIEARADRLGHRLDPHGLDRRPKVAARFGRPILELGGNNAMIVAPSADLDMAVRAIVFSAVGTAGQRCTSLRRVIVHRSIRADLTHRLVKAYAGLPIGDPRKDGTLVGPLIDHAARDKMQAALKRAEDEGGKVHGGGTVAKGVPNGGAYVEPAIVEMPDQSGIVREETFAPILYTLGYDEPGRGDRDPERRAAGPVVVDLHAQPARGGDVSVRRGLRLRHRQRQYRPVRRGDRRRFRRRKGDRRRARKRLRRLEGLYAPADQHRELFGQAAARTGSEIDV